MLRTLGKTVGSALAVLCLISTLAVAADEKEKGMEMTCVKTSGAQGSCVVGTMPDGKELVLVGTGLKMGEKMLCHHRDNMIHCVPTPTKK